MSKEKVEDSKIMRHFKGEKECKALPIKERTCVLSPDMVIYMSSEESVLHWFAAKQAPFLLQSGDVLDSTGIG